MTPLSRANSLRACFALSYIVALIIDRFDTPGAIHSVNTEKLVNWPLRESSFPPKQLFVSHVNSSQRFVGNLGNVGSPKVARVGYWRFYSWWFNRFIGSKTFIRTFFRIFGCSVQYSFSTSWCIQYTKLNRGYTATMFCKQWVTGSSIASDPVNFVKFRAQSIRTKAARLSCQFLKQSSTDNKKYFNNINQL